MAATVGGWATRAAAARAAEKCLGPALYAGATAALAQTWDSDSVARDVVRITTVSKLLRKIHRLTVALGEATFGEPVPDDRFWGRVLALLKAEHAAYEAIPSGSVRRATSTRAGERRAFVERLLGGSRSVVDGQQVASGLAYFAIAVGLDDPPTASEALTAAGIFRRDRVAGWRRLLRQARTARQRRARARRNR